MAVAPQERQITGREVPQRGHSSFSSKTHDDSQFSHRAISEHRRHATSRARPFRFTMQATATSELSASSAALLISIKRLDSIPERGSSSRKSTTSTRGQWALSVV